MGNIVKPPLGVTPKFIRDSERLTEIMRAVIRYCEAELDIPVVWIEEYNELIKIVKNGKI